MERITCGKKFEKHSSLEQFVVFSFFLLSWQKLEEKKTLVNDDDNT
jgi:hypothetical protein